jgi:hypothetical protein
MRLHNRKDILFLYLGFIIMFFVGCSSNTNSTETNNTNSTDDFEPRLYMTSGETGSLEPTTNNDEYIITLHNVPSEVRWIADRSAQISGIDTTSNFIENVWPEIFKVTAPNAILKFLLGNENDGLFLTLREPVYDADRRSISFTATLVRSTFEEGDPRLDETMEFEYPAIVILNNGAGFNFVVHSQTATMENAGQENTYTIIQNGIDEELLWASSVPSKLSSVTTMEEFANNWESFYSEEPPNAFMFGITDDGELKAYSITLESMKYSPGDIRISYSASTHDNDPIENIILNSVTLVIDSSLIAMLSSDSLFGPSILEDHLIAFTFRGVPSTEKVSTQGPSEDVMCSDADFPFDRHESLSYDKRTGDTQNVSIFDPEFSKETDFEKVSNAGWFAAWAGSLEIGIYSKLNSETLQKIAWYYCSAACVTNYDTSTGIADFLCNGKTSVVIALSKANPNREDIVNEWDMSDR